MSDSRPVPNGNVIVICITVLVVFVIASCVAAFVAVPEGSNTGALVTQLLGILAPTIAVLSVLTKTSRIEENTHRILNGEMEGKIETSLTRVLDDRTESTDAVTALNVVVDHKIQENVNKVLDERGEN